MGAYSATPITSDITSRALATQEGFTALFAANKRRHKMIGLMDYLGGQSKSRKIESNAGIITSLKIGNYIPSATISTVSLSTVTATVTVASAGAIQGFRIGFVYADKYRNLGILSAISGTTLTFKAIGGVSFPADAFEAGTIMVEAFNASAMHNSTSTNWNKWLPDEQNNYLQIQRSTMQLSRMEFVHSYVDMTTGSKEFAAAQIQKNIALNRLADGIESTMFIGQASSLGTLYNASGTAVTGSTSGGIDWAIANRGGTAIESSTFPTPTEFVDYLTTLRSKTGMVTNHFIFVGGEKARAAVADILQNYKVTAGVNSVLEGKGLAVDGMNTTFGFIEFCDTWFMADPYANPALTSLTGAINAGSDLTFDGTRKMAWEFYIMAIQPVVDFYSNDAQLGQICYKDAPGIQTTYVEGLIDANGNPISGRTSSSTDGVTVEYYTNTALDIADASPLLSFKLEE